MVMAPERPKVNITPPPLHPKQKAIVDSGARF